MKTEIKKQEKLRDKIRKQLLCYAGVQIEMEREGLFEHVKDHANYVAGEIESDFNDMLENAKEIWIEEYNHQHINEGDMIATAISRAPSNSLVHKTFRLGFKSCYNWIKK